MANSSSMICFFSILRCRRLSSFGSSVCFSFSTAFGDLVESLLKRDGGVKDSSRIIPGHGGVLDLLDAFIFNLPLFYVYISIKGALG